MIKSIKNLKFPYKLYDKGEYEGRYTLYTDKIDMGIGLLLIKRYRPKVIIPEKIKHA